MSSLSLLQWIFPTQESNRGLLHCRQILYHLSYQVSPVACQAALSMDFPRQEYWSGLPFLSPGDLPYLGTEPDLLHCRRKHHHLSHQGRI